MRLSRLSRQHKRPKRAAELLPQAQGAARQLEDAAYGIQDAAELLRACTESLQFDPDQLEETEARLDFLYRLGLKYGETEEEMLAFLENARQELAGIEGADEKIAELEAAFDEAKQEAISLAKELSAARPRGGRFVCSACAGRAGFPQYAECGLSG